MKQTSSFIKYGSIVFVFFVCTSVFGFFSLSHNPQVLSVTFADVGEGDGMIIQTPTHQTILLDGGPTHQFEQQVERVLPPFVRSIDLVILTHPHADHITGLIDILKDFHVKKVVTPDVIDDSPEALEFEKIIHEKHIPLERVSRGKSFSLGPDCSLLFLSPFQDEKLKPGAYTDEDLNTISLVARLVFRNTAFLFMGDAGFQVEDKLIKYASDAFPLHSNVLKIGHHGSRFSSTDEFLAQVHPQTAVISVGADNLFGHPHYEVVHRLKKRNIPLLRTDEHGTIKAISDGEHISFQKER